MNDILAERLNEELMELGEFKEMCEVNKKTSQIVGEETQNLLGKELVYVENLISNISKKLEDTSLSDHELEMILMRLPIQLYYLSTFLGKLDLGSATAEANFKAIYSEHYVNSGLTTTDSRNKKTVADRESEATIMAKESRLACYVWKSALVEFKSKLTALEKLLDSAKSIHYKRVEEMRMTNRGIGSDIE